MRLSGPAVHRRGADGRPPDAGVYLTLRLAVTATAGRIDLDPLRFQLVTPDYAAYATTLFGGWPHLLHATSVTPGRRLRALLVFQIPPGAAAGARVQVSDERLRPAAYWQLP